MHIKFRCSICGEEIKQISVLIRDMGFRKDLTTVNTKWNSNPCLVEFDREYLSGKVRSIIYMGCKCKEVEIIGSQFGCLEIEDFVGEGEISIADLKHEKYGSLEVIKESYDEHFISISSRSRRN